MSTKQPKLQLVLESQDPRHFSLLMAHKIQSTMDPAFLEGLCIDRIRRYFFVNQGWRLSNSGFQAVSAYYTYYASSCERNNIITGKILLNMDFCIGGPWFLRGSTIHVFDPTAHFELQMFEGNLGAFVDFKRVN